MSVNAGTVRAELVLESSKYQNGITKAKTQMQVFGKTVQQARGHMDKAGNHAHRMGQNIKKAGDHAEHAGHGFFAMYKDMLLMSSVMAALTATFAPFVAAYQGIKYNANIEQSAIAFETLLGSAKKAKVMLKDLKEFAARTPFEYEGVEESAKLMLAMGFNAKKIMPNLKTVGSAVAAIGGNDETIKGVTMALGQMMTKGKVSAEEMNQLAERGIPAWDLMAKKMGMSKEELMKLSEEGKVLADRAIPALLDAMGEKYAGAMDKQSKSILGMFSTIKDYAKQSLGTFMGPLTEQIGKAMPGVIEWFEKLRKSGKLEKWGQGIADGITLAVDALKDLGTKIKPAITFLNNLKDLAEKGDWKGFGKSIGKGLKVGLKAIGEDITKILKNIIGDIDWYEIGKASIGVVVGFALGIVDGILDPMVWWDIIKEHWDSILMLLVGVIAAPAPIIGKIGAGLAKVPLVGKFASWLLTSISNVGKKIVSPIGNTFKDWGGAFVTKLAESLGLSGKGFKILPKIKESLDNAVKGIIGFGEDFYLKGLYFVEKLATGIGSKARVPLDKARLVIAYIDEALAGFISKCIAKGADIAKAIGNGIKNSINAVRANAREMFEAAVYVTQRLVSGIGSKIRLAKQKTLEVMSAVYNAVRTRTGQLYDRGRDIIQGLINGIRSKIGAIKDAVTDAMSALTGKVKKILGINSPSKVFKGFGENIGEGLALGMNKANDLVKQASLNMASLTMSPITGSGSTKNYTTNSKSFSPTIQNYYTERAYSPAEENRKQRQMLRNLAMGWGV